MKNVILANDPATFLPPAAVLHRALAPLLGDEEATAEQILRSARRRHAEMIVVRTPAAPQGAARARWGGLTQTLIEQTRVPVLSLRPRAPVPTAFRRAMFLSDLSPKSARSFRALLKLMKRGSTVVIYHHMEAPVLPAAEYPATFGQADLIERMAEANELQARTTVDRWALVARAKGVKLEFAMSHASRSLGEDVRLATRRTRADVLAMTVDPHPVSRILLGSTVTELLQSSKKPVIILPATGA